VSPASAGWHVPLDRRQRRARQRCPPDQAFG
jgi:hypothetical protein